MFLFLGSLLRVCFLFFFVDAIGGVKKCKRPTVPQNSNLHF